MLSKIFKKRNKERKLKGEGKVKKSKKPKTNKKPKKKPKGKSKNEVSKKSRKSKKPVEKQRPKGISGRARKNPPKEENLETTPPKQGRPITESKIDTRALVCKSLETVNGRVNIEEQKVVPIYSSIEGKYVNLQVLIQNRGNVSETTHQYLMIREEGFEVNPSEVIARKVDTDKPIQDQKYLLLEKVPVNNEESTFEIITIDVAERLDDVVIKNTEYMTVELDPILVRRIFEVGKVTSNASFLAMSGVS